VEGVNTKVKTRLETLIMIDLFSLDIAAVSNAFA
jgi:hypothetical protein